MRLLTQMRLLSARLRYVKNELFEIPLLAQYIPRALKTIASVFGRFSDVICFNFEYFVTLSILCHFMSLYPRLLASILVLPQFVSLKELS